MKSIKPGRGRSGMEVIFGVFSVAFGVFWTVLAFAMTQGLGLFGVIFPLFGVFFVVMGLIRTVYAIQNTFGENRHSEYDITEEGEEPDPFDPRNAHREDLYRDKAPGTPPYQSMSHAREGGFCPYCGAPVEADYEFCRHCGKKLS